MAEQWRIFVVEDEESLNRNIVSSLRKDGYIVNGATNGRDAVRTLWAEEHDIVICDLNTPGAEGFELLQWLRAYRPNTRVILVGESTPTLRTQALEGGAVGYLEKPLDLHLLKEELRRLLVQTGFSADLDSFDLLDVIQIISASRKNIALLVSTGLEERGMLCFYNGNLVWAEYGTLRGEEAFFALAAHKNGTVIHQPWNQQVTPNVTQPLSRLILQAFQYRTKYNQIQQQLSGEYMKLPPSPPVEDEDAPFLVLTEHVTDEPQEPFPVQTDAFVSLNTGHPVQEQRMQGRDGKNDMSQSGKEWWEQTGKFSGAGMHPLTANVPATPLVETQIEEDEKNVSSPAQRKITTDLSNGDGSKHESVKRRDLPSWLTDQPTASNMAAMRDSLPSIPARNFRPSSPVTPVVPTPTEWQPTRPRVRTPRKLAEQRVKEMKGMTGPQKTLQTDTASRKAASPEWQPTDGEGQTQSGPLQNLDASSTTLPMSRRQITNGMYRTSSSDLQAMPLGDNAKRNHNSNALVSALQTLGYSINGFVAAAVVSIDGQPIAQVAIDELDLSLMCKHFSMIIKSAFQSLDIGAWGEYEHIVLTSADRYVLLRVIGSDRKAFQVLITTRAANPVTSDEVMANVEGAITAALH